MGLEQVFEFRGDEVEMVQNKSLPKYNRIVIPGRLLCNSQSLSFYAPNYLSVQP